MSSKTKKYHVTNDDIINLEGREDLIKNKPYIIDGVISYITKCMYDVKKDEVLDHYDYIISALLKFKDASKKYNGKPNWKSYVLILIRKRIFGKYQAQKRDAEICNYDSYNIIDDFCEHNNLLDVYYEDDGFSTMELDKILNSTEYEIVKLRYEGYNYTEISEIMSIGVTTIRRNISIIKKKISHIVKI